MMSFRFSPARMSRTPFGSDRELRHFVSMLFLTGLILRSVKINPTVLIDIRGLATFK